MGCSFGFSWKGLLTFLLMMIPNLVYFLLPNPNVPGTGMSNHLILDILEHASQAIFLCLLLFLVSKQSSPLVSPYTVCIAILLLAYYALWIFYFAGGNSLPPLLGMAVLPVAYFILAEIWLHNLPALVPTAVFGAVHILITYMDGRYAH